MLHMCVWVVTQGTKAGVNQAHHAFIGTSDPKLLSKHMEFFPLTSAGNGWACITLVTHAGLEGGVV